MDASDNQPGPLPGPERGGDGDGDEHHTVPQDSASAPRQRLYKSILERTRPVQTDALSYTRNRASDYIYFCRSNFRAAHSSMPRHLQAEHQLVLYHNVWHHVTFQFSEWPAGQSLSRVTDATKLNLCQSAAGVAGTLLNLPSSQECLNALFYELGNNYLGLDPSMGHPRGTAAGHRIRCDVVFKNNIDALSYTAASVVNNEGGGMCCLNNRLIQSCIYHQPMAHPRRSNNRHNMTLFWAGIALVHAAVPAILFDRVARHAPNWEVDDATLYYTQQSGDAMISHIFGGSLRFGRLRTLEASDPVTSAYLIPSDPGFFHLQDGDLLEFDAEWLRALVHYRGFVPLEQNTFYSNTHGPGAFHPASVTELLNPSTWAPPYLQVDQID